MADVTSGCCGSRRSMLRLALLAGAMPLFGAVPTARAASLRATDLEVVTVTDTSVIVTWTTDVPADTELRLTPADALGPPRTVLLDSAPTPFHYAEFHSLEPGRNYRFEAYSNGVQARPALSVVTGGRDTPESTGVITTLMPPPGRYLRTVALANDVHHGEEVSGLIAGGLPPGFEQEPGLPPYPVVMLDAMLGDLRKPDRDARHLVVAGDLTAEASQADSAAVRTKLDSWGRFGEDYLVCRGNHDRPHAGADHWGKYFVPRQQLRHSEFGGLRLIGLDTTQLEAPGGTIDPPQLDALRTLLKADPDRPTVMFSHHPVTREAAMTNLSGPTFVLDCPSAASLEGLYSRAPGVFLHHSGHTHRNRRTQLGGPVEYLEVGAVKEYPGGYSLLRLYEGGYMVNFYKTRTELARRWSARSRGEYYGLMREYTFGTLQDRNHVVVRDLSGLTRHG